MSAEGDVQAVVPFSRWRATDVPFETEPFPREPKPVKVSTAGETNDVRALSNGQAKPDSLSSSGTVHSITAGGIAASQIDIPLAPMLVAPNSANERNTIKQSIAAGLLARARHAL